MNGYRTLRCCFRKISRITFSFCLAALLLWLSAGLTKDAFASQKNFKIRKNLTERLKYINKLKASSVIEKDLKESLAEVKISSKINGIFGLNSKSKLRLPKRKIFQGIGATTPQPKLERMNVIFELSPAGVDLNSLISRGVIIRNQHKNLIEVEAPLQNIERIVEEFDEILYARSPKKFFPLEVISEGVSLSGAIALHDRGCRGQGVKVAIIDVGFKGLSDAQANGDLPYDVITRDFTGRGLQTQYKHGTGCAEIIHDMAPDAQLYLIKIMEEMDFYNAFDYCINENIDIISSSLGTFGTGPGDGTGSVCEAADEARENGILAINAAGNSATVTVDDMTIGFHWKGTFRDTNGDGIHEFNPELDPDNPESIVNMVVGLPDFDDDGNPETEEISIILRWNDWPNANVDYDLFLFDADFNLVDSSMGTQDGSQPPLEEIIRDVPSSSTDGEAYFLTIMKYSGESSGVEIELFTGQYSLFYPYYTVSSSICEPADAESVIAVGAIDIDNWLTGPQEEFSSQGPTNAWVGSSARIKPDICGPDDVTTYIYGSYISNPHDELGSFAGTSAATPYVAGAAALILSANPNLTPDELQSLLEDNAIDMGASGKDNIYGWGRLNIPEALAYSSIVINEFVPNPDGDNVEWVELYNKGKANIDIGGCYIDDITAGGGFTKEIPSGTIIPAGGYYSLTVYNGDGYFNNKGDTVNLLMPDGATVIDSKSHGDVSAYPDCSIYRYPDGQDWAMDFNPVPTRDTANDEPQEKGDINNDGKVNSADAILCLRFAVGLDEPTSAQRYAADMNDDGKINSADAIKILRKAVGLE